MSLIEHAKRELQAIGYNLDEKEEGPDKWIVANIIELLEVFAKQGHSGSSAPYCVGVLTKLASYEPLCPLTGEDSEWNDVSDTSKEPMWQNKRCSHVFKGADGKAYDLDGKVFREPDGYCYTNRDSLVYIEFPYTPKTEHVDIENSDKWVNVKDMVKRTLETNGYDGLYNVNGDCACEITELMPCSCRVDQCKAGYKEPCDCGDHDFHIVEHKDEEGR